MFKNKPIIGITMGDPAGIGPEIIVKSLQNRDIINKIQPVLIGNEDVFKRAILENGLKISIKRVECPICGTLLNKNIQLIVSDTLKGITKKGGWNRKTAISSFQAVEKGVKLALDGRINALVTAPICKEAWNSIGVTHAGHTELLGIMTKTKGYSMMFVGGAFKLILLTIHQPLSAVPKSIKKEKVIQVGITGEMACKKYFRIKHPHIAVAGLNPHAGEGGILGKEEQREIIPALAELSKRRDVHFSGPYSPDTLFVDAAKGKYDLVICMYHDQGLIPFKMLSLHQGVNVTVGLPIIRTSPDHGTGFDIAGKRRANPGSMTAAISTAFEMVQNSSMAKNRNFY
ncbi:4-hydroxythreonine-4-phosphate dehydrogenase PdxA [candidate division FCPU426 bacterium]|nr:4-hydroxythreonine-4-phosphate dehydrogenase PdxA [candidate division FCPU426 bacterium]